MIEDLHLNLNTLVMICGYVVSIVILITRMDSKQKSQQELSELKFLAAADKIRSVEVALIERVKGLEGDVKEKHVIFSNQVEDMTKKFDVLNREVLNKLFDIEKALERLKGQLGIIETNRGG